MLAGEMWGSILVGARVSAGPRAHRMSTAGLAQVLHYSTEPLPTLHCSCSAEMTKLSVERSVIAEEVEEPSSLAKI